MHPKKISIHDYTYELPAEAIADYPLAERDPIFCSRISCSMRSLSHCLIMLW